jgi:PhnB protein
MKQLHPYLNFDGTCREAMTFYGKCLGAELQVMPFSKMPGNVPKGAEDRVMHSCLMNGSALLMASDTMPGTPLQPGTNFSVSIQCESLEEIERLFAALCKNGKVMMPLDDMFWGARFGMLTDQFGIQWMLNFELPKSVPAETTG